MSAQLAHTLLTDRETRERHLSKLAEQARALTWDATASAMVDAYREAVRAPVREAATLSRDLVRREARLSVQSRQQIQGLIGEREHARQMYDSLNAGGRLRAEPDRAQRFASRRAPAGPAGAQRKPAPGPARCRMLSSTFLLARSLARLGRRPGGGSGSRRLRARSTLDTKSAPSDTAGRPALAAKGVNKVFRIPEERSHTLKERALHPLRRTRYEQLHALKDINFSVAPGEFFGIVGRNGSGKSTLLKCMAGIYGLDSGQIWANGRMSTFIELGVGFNADLAAYDNVVLNGVMLGLSSRETRARYERVIEFAELEEFQELKLKNYSSGMHVRLAFSVAIQVDADILIIDEVLAVGDAAFQQKCFDVFTRMREEGRTIIFVTHDMGAVTRFCHRALLLERGEKVMIGEPDDVADRYLEIAFGRDVGYEEYEVATPRMGDGAARVSEVWLGDDRSEGRTIARQSEPLTLNVLVKFNEQTRRSRCERDAAQRTPPARGGRHHQRRPRGIRRLPGGRARGVQLLDAQHARPGALPPDRDDHSPRRGPRRDRPLHPRHVVRRHGPGRERRDGGDTGGDRRESLGGSAL